jgi:hypothetical protein
VSEHIEWADVRQGFGVTTEPGEWTDAFETQNDGPAVAIGEVTVVEGKTVGDLIDYFERIVIALKGIDPRMTTPAVPDSEETP